MNKKESFIRELDDRARLWEQKKANAQGRIELGVEVPLAKIDLAVAEDALERIAKKKEELLDKKPKIDYTDPTEMKALKKRVHKKAKALYEHSSAPTIVEMYRTEGDKKDG